jgi:hypothetical protein
MRTRTAARVPIGVAGFVLSALLFPLTVVLHELGHFLVGRSFGFPTLLHAASVTGLPETPPFDGEAGGVALAALAGPAVTLALAALGLLYRTRVWGLPLMATALVRFLVNLLYMVQQGFVAAGIAAASDPNFDEVLAARALGVAPQPLAAVGALLLLAGLVFLWRQAGGRGFFVLMAGTVAGMTLWLALLGPRLLP